MRAASYLAGTIIAIGIHLMIAASFALSPAFIGLGILAIALIATVSFMALGRAPSRRTTF
ncbi:MAG: hypothetical protein ACRDGV_06600 [Candidatus Limnocylindria bacterium]